MHCDMLKIQDGVAIVEKLNFSRVYVRMKNALLENSFNGPMFFGCLQIACKGMKLWATL